MQVYLPTTGAINTGTRGIGTEFAIQSSNQHKRNETTQTDIGQHASSTLHKQGVTLT